MGKRPRGLKASLSTNTQDTTNITNPNDFLSNDRNITNPNDSPSNDTNDTNLTDSPSKRNKTQDNKNPSQEETILIDQFHQFKEGSLNADLHDLYYLYNQMRNNYASLSLLRGIIHECDRIFRKHENKKNQENQDTDIDQDLDWRVLLPWWIYFIYAWSLHRLAIIEEMNEFNDFANEFSKKSINIFNKTKENIKDQRISNFNFNTWELFVLFASINVLMVLEKTDYKSNHSIIQLNHIFDELNNNLKNLNLDNKNVKLSQDISTIASRLQTIPDDENIQNICMKFYKLALKFTNDDDCDINLGLGMIYNQLALPFQIQAESILEDTNINSSDLNPDIFKEAIKLNNKALSCFELAYQNRKEFDFDRENELIESYVESLINQGNLNLIKKSQNDYYYKALSIIKIAKNEEIQIDQGIIDQIEDLNNEDLNNEDLNNEDEE